MTAPPRYRVTWWKHTDDEHPVFRWFKGAEAKTAAFHLADQLPASANHRVQEWVDGQWRKANR